jgi:hypothetical protein
MAYLGTSEGIKGHRFMRLENNVIFLGATAIFDETVYPKCFTQKCHATTHVNEPIEHQPSLEPPSTPNGKEIVTVPREHTGRTDQTNSPELTKT